MRATISYRKNCIQTSVHKARQIRRRTTRQGRAKGVVIRPRGRGYAEGADQEVAFSLRPRPSYAGLTRVSIHLRESPVKRWIAGSSPAMTVERETRRTGTHASLVAYPSAAGTGGGPERAASA